MSSWRLIIDGALSAHENMAMDRAVQVARDEGLVPATLRLYTWERPTASLGRFQDASRIDSQLCAELGVDLVRRFTGGRGVLHDDEVTYCVVGATTDGVPRGIANSYLSLSTALVRAYRRLGLGADLVSREGGAKGSPACYLHTTSADLASGGRKLSGSAQVWLHNTVMQHGSLVITRDVNREAAVFGLDAVAAAKLADSAVTLADELDELPSRQEIMESVAVGFEEALGVSLEPGLLTDRERAIAATLLEQVKVSGVVLT